MKIKNPTNLVVVDLETSGTNPFEHEVLSLSFVPLSPSLPALDVYVRPSDVKWSRYARANFAKYAETWERRAVSPEHACNVIEDYLSSTFNGDDATPVGHNIGFDVAFLRKLAFLGGRAQLAHLSHRCLDTHTILYLLAAAGRIPTDAVSSTAAFDHFGIIVDEVDRHTARGDALATRELFVCLLNLLGEDG